MSFVLCTSRSVAARAHPSSIRLHRAVMLLLLARQPLSRCATHICPLRDMPPRPMFAPIGWASFHGALRTAHCRQQWSRTVNSGQQDCRGPSPASSPPCAVSSASTTLAPCSAGHRSPCCGEQGIEHCRSQPASAAGTDPAYRHVLTEQSTATRRKPTH